MPSIFSPPRNKPKISFSKPTMPVGQPFVAPQVIDRPVNLVDDMGNVHGRLGENPNGPERVSVTPPPGPTNDPAGGPNYSSGGDLLIGGSSGGAGGLGNVFGQQFMQTQNQPVQPQGQIAPTIQPTYPGFSNPGTAMWNAQQNQISARNNVYDQRANVLDLKGGLFPLKSAITNLRGQAIGQQEQQNQMQAGVYGQQQANEQARLGELTGIYAASKNAPDILNTGEATNRYRAEDRRAGKMGVAPEAEVNLPPEYNGPRTPGIRPKIMTQEQRLSEQAGYEDPIRNEQLSLAQTAVSLKGTDVRKAELAAAKAGLTLEEAQQVVDKAQLQEDYANLISGRADLGAQEAGIAPFPGAEKWTDPATGQERWVTPLEKDQLQTQYQQNVQLPYNASIQNAGVPPSFQGLSIPQVLNTLPKNATLGSPEAQPILDAITQKLINERHLDPEAARQAAYELFLQEIASRPKSGGGLTLPLNPGTPSVATTTQTAPASAPTGNSSADEEAAKLRAAGLIP